MSDNYLNQNDLAIIRIALKTYVIPLPVEITPSENVLESFRADQEKSAKIQARSLNSQEEAFFLSAEEFELVFSSIKSLIDDYRHDLQLKLKPKQVKALHNSIRAANVCLSRLTASGAAPGVSAVQPE